jgi:hypothetical protein
LAWRSSVCGRGRLWERTLSDFHGESSYESNAPRSYKEAARTFSEFVAGAFAIGSDAKDAIAQIIRGGFEVIKSNSDSVELLWARHSGPCSEQYSIVVNKNADGTIAKMTGRLRPICL